MTTFPKYKLIVFKYGIGKAEYTSYSILDELNFTKFMSGLSIAYNKLMKNEAVAFSIGDVYWVGYSDVESLKKCIEYRDINEYQIATLESLNILKNDIGMSFVATIMNLVDGLK